MLDDKIKELKPQTFATVCASLTPVALKLVNSVDGFTREYFRDNGKVPLVYYVASEDVMQIVDIVEMGPENKPEVFEMMRAMRTVWPAAAFTTEAWVSGDMTYGRHASKDPHREERGILAVWDGKRTVVFAAHLNRSPNSLGDWVTWQDSARSDNMVVGDMVEGHAKSD